MKLDIDTKYWPEKWRYLYEERWAIKHFDGGMGEMLAKVKAEREVRELAKESADEPLAIN